MINELISSLFTNIVENTKTLPIENQKTVLAYIIMMSVIRLADADNDLPPPSDRTAAED